MITLLIILASAAVFVAALMGTKEIMVCEALRVIPGKWFPWIWLAAAAAALIITLMLLDFVTKRWNRGVLDRLREMTITHTELPHLQQYDMLVLNGYYLLRLYLQGIVKYQEVNVERGKKKNWIALDEERLEAVKAQGGRHSVAAIEMVRCIRETPECSIEQIMKHTFQQKPEKHEIHGKVERLKVIEQWLAALVLAAVMGCLWGILGAKLALANRYDKPVGHLYLMIMGGITLTPFLWWKFKKTFAETLEAEKSRIIAEKHQERPHDVDERLINRIKDVLPSEIDRNRILNAFLFENTRLLGIMHAKKNRGTFMFRFASEYYKGLAAIEAYKRRMLKLKSGSAGGGSGCSSCGSCSSCSSCGGCGGCGD